jgi:hypothetical protein
MAGVEISGFLACFFGDSGAKDSMCLCIRQLQKCSDESGAWRPPKKKVEIDKFKAYHLQ